MSDICDVAAERAVLAGLFSYGASAYADVGDIVSTRTFTDECNQVLYRCLQHLLSDTPMAQADFPSVLSAAQSLGLAHVLEKQEDRTYLRAVMNFPVKRENVRSLAGKIRKLEVARLLFEQLREAGKSVERVSGDESIDKILALAEGPIFDLATSLSGKSEGVRLMGEGAEEYAQYLMDNPRQMMGISTGIKGFDLAIGGGLRPNSVDVIAARAKVGKTMLVDNVSLHIAGKLGIPVFNLDTEMSWEEHLHRVLGNLAGVETHDIETGKCGVKGLSRQKVLEAARRLKAMPYHYQCIIGCSFEEVLGSMRRWVLRHVGLDENGKAKPCVIIYDYIKLMSSDFLSGDMKEFQALGYMMTALKNFMGRYGVACLAFAQTNRDGIDREDTDVVGGSDRIVHYCTSLTLYKKKSEEERAEAGTELFKYTHKLVPLISRHGEGLQAGDYINIQADYKRATIIEGPRRDVAEHVKGGQPLGVTVDREEQTPVDFAA